MTPEEKHKQRLRLKAVTKEQWADAFDDLTEALSSPYLLGGRAVVGPHKRKILVGARTLYGVHSHYNLGTSNVLYHYQADLILALYDCKWRWPEDVSLSDMLIRIACSRIPKAVEKYRKQKEKEEKEGIKAAWETIGEVVKRVTSSDDGNVENPEGEENGSNTGGGNRTHHRGETLWAEVAVLAAFAFCFGQTPERKSAKWGNKIWPNNQTNFG